MSEQGVTALLERLESDQGFRERLEAAPTNEAKRQIVLDAGYEVGPSDLPAIRTQAGLREVSDEDLEKIAGGIGSATSIGVGVSGGVATAASIGVALAAAIA